MSNFDPLDTQAQEQAQAERKQQQRITSDQQIADLKWVLSNEKGRRFIWWLLGLCGLFRLSFSGSKEETSFREGMRNVSLILTSEITKHCHDRYIQMMTEQHNERQRKSKR